THTIIRQRDRRGSSRVIDFVHSSSTDRQRTRGYVRRRASSSVKGIVCGIRTADADPAYRDRFTRAHVLVREAGAGVTVIEYVARNAVITQGNRDTGGAVVNFVYSCCTDGQPASRDYAIQVVRQRDTIIRAAVAIIDSGRWAERLA